MSDHGSWVGRTETATDRVDGPRIAALAAVLDRPAAIIPLGWHWTHFQHWAPQVSLGRDGLSARGGFLPAVDNLPRRMFAGGRLTFPGVLRDNEEIARTSTILKVTEKAGTTGRLVFVTVRHEIAGAAGVAITEEQDIVYRGLAGAAVRDAAAPPPVLAGAAVRVVTPDPVLLFRYSALTANGHRIHYDRAYATGVEGYPGLVVHGPLQATLLLDMVSRNRPDLRVAGFTFRAMRPLFDSAPFDLVCVEDGVSARLETRDAEGQVCMEASARLTSA